MSTDGRRPIGPPAQRTAQAARRATSTRAGPPQLPEGAITVSRLAADMRRQLDGLGDVLVVGEISGLKVVTGGHWTFDLKDSDAKVSVIVFFNHASRHRGAAPADGDMVVVRGRASYHPSFGKAQLLGTTVTPLGEGELQRQLDELRDRLAAEGLFALERKRPLPALPRTVGVVTSLQGAAVRDVVKVLRARAPDVSILIANTKVQGDGAAADIAEAIRALDACGACDIILVVRGGGAREDLHAFNTEPVVRAIARCSVPVIAGVGHETDTTFADLAADVRAATPSHAGTLAVPVLADVRARIDALERRLASSLTAQVGRAAHRLALLQQRLPAPATLLARHARPLQRLEGRLAAQSPRARLQQKARALAELERRLVACHPRAAVVRADARRMALSRRMNDAVHRRLADARSSLSRAVTALDALSPLAVLQRGWALATVRAEDHGGAERLARATDLVPGARLRLRIEAGDADVVVDTVRKPERA